MVGLVAKLNATKPHGHRERPPWATNGWPTLFSHGFSYPKPILSCSSKPKPWEHDHHTWQRRSTTSPPLMTVDLSLCFSFRLTPFVALSLFGLVLSFGWFGDRLWKLEDFLWFWEVRACRSVGFDVFFVNLDRKSWFHGKLLRAQNVVF